MEEKIIEPIKNTNTKQTPFKNPYQIHKNSMSFLDKFAIWMTSVVGTMGFFFACVILATIPLFVNTTMTTIHYISSGFLQLVLLPLILIGQNLQSRYAEIRAQHDFETNTKAEKEIENIIMYLEKQDIVMTEIRKKLEKIEKGK